MELYEDIFNFDTNKHTFRVFETFLILHFGPLSDFLLRAEKNESQGSIKTVINSRAYRRFFYFEKHNTYIVDFLLSFSVTT